LEIRRRLPQNSSNNSGTQFQFFSIAKGHAVSGAQTERARMTNVYLAIMVVILAVWFIREIIATDKEAK